MRKLILIVAILSLATTSCIEIPSEEKASSDSGTTDLPSVHPDPIEIPVEKVAVEKRGSLVSRKYIKELFKEIFNSTAYPHDITRRYPYSNSESLIDTFLNLPSSFGASCDQNSSAGDADCGGSVVTGTIVPLYPESTGAHQMNLTNLCEIAISHQANAIKAAAEKISEIPGGVINEINSTNIPKIFGLFFRQRAMTSAELNAYVDFNANLVARGKTKNERWVAILTMVCESPEWQSL